MISAPSAITLPFFQTGDEASSRDAQCPSVAAPQQVFPDASPGGPARAILQCFAGQARVASALIAQGYFAYGVDRVKHKSAMAPVLQMDLSSRTSCDSILTWLDKQKIAGVLICIPKHALDPISAAFVFAVINGCLDRDLPLVVEGSCKSPFWMNMSQLPDARQAPHWVEVDWGCWIPTSQQRSFVMSNLPEIATVRREGREPAGKWTASEVSSAGYPRGFATALAEVFAAGVTARKLLCSNPSLANKALRVSAMHQPRGHLNEVMPEWKVVVYVLLPCAATEDPFSGCKRLKQEWQIPDGARVLPGMATLPVDSQLLSRTQTGGHLSPQLQQEMQRLDGASVRDSLGSD